MLKLSLQVADSIHIRTVKRDGKAVAFTVAPADIPAAVNAKIYEVGMKTILTNVYNGGGKDASESERLAAMNKKLDAWKRGEFVVVERGESFFTAWREVFIADCIAAGMTTRQAESVIKDKVTERLGKETKATFDNYLNAVALEYVEAGEAADTAEAREALEAYYGGEAQRRAEETAKKAVKIEAPKIDLSAFKKAAK